MKNYLKFLIVFLLSIILAGIFAFIGRNIYGLISPSNIMGDLGDIVEPGIVEGFIFMYLFFIPALFIPVFKNKAWQYLAIPSLIVFLPIVLAWQISVIALGFFLVGVGIGYLVLWLKKKI